MLSMLELCRIGERAAVPGETRFALHIATLFACSRLHSAGEPDAAREDLFSGAEGACLAPKAHARPGRLDEGEWGRAQRKKIRRRKIMRWLWNSGR